MGDVLLGVSVPAKVLVDEPLDFAKSSDALASSEYLQDVVTQVRLAFVLSWEGQAPPAMIPSWNYFIEALNPGSGWSWNDLPLFANKTPTLLTVDQVNRWKYWIEKIERVSFSKLGPAPVRILRASGERRDPYDSLIDAVIAWESLFGTDSEITFRLSASIARLLESPGKERNDLRRRATEIYRMRSKVVHGIHVPVAEVADASREAVAISIACMRKLISDRADLLKMTSLERSTTILME
ncbi:hypothetical protein ACFY3O_05690 [Streptomyces sp. NPDC001046]|uniref:hypothetical protein n=1 Tax=Streptomyces sp. NPDC001046 TaxID=3364543 RepID=UPI0036AFCD41